MAGQGDRSPGQRHPPPWFSRKTPPSAVMPSAGM